MNKTKCEVISESPGSTGQCICNWFLPAKTKHG